MNVNADLFQKADKLHLTVGTLVLLDDEERIKAAQTLADCRDKIRWKWARNLEFKMIF